MTTKLVDLQSYSPERQALINDLVVYVEKIWDAYRKANRKTDDMRTALAEAQHAYACSIGPEADAELLSAMERRVAFWSKQFNEFRDNESDTCWTVAESARDMAVKRLGYELSEKLA